MQCLGTWPQTSPIGEAATAHRRQRRHAAPLGPRRQTDAPSATRATAGSCRAREVERLSARPRRHATGDALSARNRFPGVVRSVEVDGVMALVEIEAGPFLVTAAITRDSVEELGLSARRRRDRGGEGDLRDDRARD